MQRADRPTLERYAALIEELVAPPAAPVPTEDASTVQVEQGSVLPMALAGARDGQIVRAVAGMLAAAATPPSRDTRVVDAAGHHRPAYRGLLVYAWQRALALVEDRLPLQRARAWNARVREWCVVLHAELASADVGAGDARSASTGAEVSGQAWAALALHAAGYGDAAAPVFSRLIDGQQPSGAFFPPGASDNPETRWYHELVLLHACSSYAVNADDPRAAESAGRAAAYHVAETQPDHATSQPWGLLAFALSDPARPLADEMLHTVRIRQADGPDGVTQILLADTLLGLRRLMPQ